MFRISDWRLESSVIQHLNPYGPMVMMFPRPVNSAFHRSRYGRPAWLKTAPAPLYTAVFRCRIGAPKVRLAAASIMVLVSRP